MPYRPPSPRQRDAQDRKLDAMRERRKARARQLFRCLKAGRKPTIEPAMQARIDAMARTLVAPNVEAQAPAEGASP